MKTKEKVIQEEIQSFMKDRRIALGIKQSEVEKISGMKTRMLQKFEQTGEITLKNMIKLFIAYKMDHHIIPAMTDRKWWAIEEIERAKGKDVVWLKDLEK